MQMLLDLCRSRVLHTSTLGCFGRQLRFIVSFGREEIITLQLFCSIFMVNALDCQSQRLSTHMLQPITYSVRQAVSLLIDQSIIFFFHSVWRLYPLYLCQKSMYEANEKKGKRIIHFHYHVIRESDISPLHLKQTLVFIHLYTLYPWPRFAICWSIFHYLGLNIGNECSGKKTQPR